MIRYAKHEGLRLKNNRLIEIYIPSKPTSEILAHINRKQEHLVSVMAGTGIRAPPTIKVP